MDTPHSRKEIIGKNQDMDYTTVLPVVLNNFGKLHLTK